MSTIRGWWEEDRVLTQKFFNRELQSDRRSAAYGGTVDCAKRRAAVLCVAGMMWSIFQWQDLVGMDGNLRRDNNTAERINIPAYPNYYWRYRLHISLEKMLQAEGFNSQLKQMIREAGR